MFGTGSTYSVGYSYDANGNRIQVVRTNANNVTTTYPYAQAGLNDQFVSGEGYSFSSYDNDGNPTAISLPGSSMGLVYDETSRVKSISGAGASTFRYDGDGRRVERVSGGVTTRFVYDGDQAVIETNGSNAVQLYRLPGVGYVKGGVQYYEQENAQGSVLAVRDSSGPATVQGRTFYDAYGIEFGASGAERGAQRFAGQKGYQNDDATGMQLLGARYYLPVLGRFLTQDPIGHEGGLNLYAYCDDSPLLRVDPSGHGPDWAAMWQGFTQRASRVGNGLYSWGMAGGITADWLIGVGPKERNFSGPGVMWNAFVHSATAEAIEAKIRATGYMKRTGWMSNGIKTWPAFHNSISEPYNGAQFMAGAVSFDAIRRGDRVFIHAYNDITTYSALFHNPQWFGAPDQLPYGDSFGGFMNIHRPMGTVRLNYYWSMPVRK
jgi:RHS repeat-associated protein